MATDIIIQLKELASTLKRGEGKSTLYGAVTEIEYLRKEVVSLRNQNDQIISKIYDLNKSINDPGPNPKFHFSVMKKHRKEWPTLWHAIDYLIKK